MGALLFGVVARPAFALGPNAIVAGFNSTTYGGNDDGSYPCTGTGAGVPGGCTPTAIALPFSPDFFGTTYGSVFLNNNGDLTFGQALSTFTPYPLSQQGPPIIAPFFADVDTRTGNPVTFGTGTVNGHNAFGVNWPGVGCYSETTSVLNYFQVLLIDRSDIFAGDFDIEFNYDQVQWDSGQASGGNSSCLGGTAARAGYASGSGATGSYFEIPGSGVDGAFLDSTATGLIHGDYGTSQAGRYIYPFRNGQALTTTGAPQTATGTATGHSSRHDPTCNNGPYPVNCASGDFWHTFTDVAVPGRGPALNLSRTYNSLTAAAAGIFGDGWSSSYDQHLTTNPDGSVTITEDDGSTVTATNNGNGTYLVPSWADSTLNQNSDGTWTFVRQGTQNYKFSSSGQLLSISDPNGYTTALAYSLNGQLATVTDSAGRQLTFTFGGNGFVSQVTDPAGHTDAYAYDANGNLVSVTDPAGRVTSFTYDANHLLLTMTDPRGGVVTNTYDPQGRALTQTDPLGRVTTYSYAGTNFSASGGTTTVTDPDGNQTVENYTNGELMSLTKASGTSSASTWTYSYDPNTLGITSTTDPNGHTTKHTYDTNGNPTTDTDPLGRTTTMAWNSLNDVTSLTDPAGNNTTATYDSNGNLLSVSRPLSSTQTQTVSYGYGDNSHPGDITSITDPDGHISNFSYDSNGDLTSTVDPLGDTTTYTYDVIGQRTSTVTPRGNMAGANPANYTTSYAYDSDGELVKVSDPLGDNTAYTYDANGNRASTTDANGNTTSYVYDAANELTQITRPDGSTLAYVYDGDGNQTAYTDGAGHTTHYVYNPLNQQVSVTDPLGRVTSSTYDGVGNRITTVDAKGQTTTFGYDAADELSSITYSDGKTPNVHYVYDADGHRASMTDGTGTTTYSYDSLSRLTSRTDGSGSTTRYGYDLVGNVTQLTYPDGSVVTRSYDAANQLSSVTDPSGRVTSFQHDPDGNITSQADPNSTSSALIYNNADQLTSITDTKAGATSPFMSISYGRDANGQLSSESANSNFGSHTYSQTQLNQIHAYDNGTYGYDHADNLTSMPNGVTPTGQAGTTNQNFDQANQLQSAPATPITLVTTGSAADSVGDQTSLDVPLASLPNAGDQIIVATTVAATATVQPPSGYSTLGVFYSSQGNKVVAFRKTSAGLDVEVLVKYPDASASHLEVKSLAVAVYRGVDPVNPIEATSAATAKSNTTGSTSLTIPSVSTITSGDKLLALESASSLSSTSGTWTPPSGMTTRIRAASSSLGNVTEVADQSLTASGATGSRTATYNTGLSDLIGALVALRPYQAQYSYDSDGNRTVSATPGQAAANLGYDQANHLISYTPSTYTGAGTTTFNYNGDGLRASKTVNGTSTNFFWDTSQGTPELLTERTPSTQTNYVYGPSGQVIEQLTTPFITLVATGSAVDSTGNTQNMTVNFSAPAAPGDQILVAATEPAQTRVYTPTGYNTAAVNYSPNHNIQLVFNKTASGGESSVSIYYPPGSSTIGPITKSISVAVYRNVDPNNPIDVTSQGAISGNSYTTGPEHIVVPAATTTSSNDRLLIVESAISTLGGTSGSFSPPSGMNTRVHAATNTLPNVTDIADQSLFTSGPTGPRTASYANGLTDLMGTLIALRPNPQAFFYHRDQLGSTRAVTDINGNVVASFNYDPYGRTVAATLAPNTAFVNTIGYAGAYTDGETGLLYLVNRYYDPATAQFLSVDPLIAATESSYGYAADDPLNSTDPLGLFCWSAHCLLNDASHVLSYISAATGVAAEIAAVIPGVGTVIAAGLQGISDLTGIGATAADIAQCLTSSCDSTQIALDLLALIPGAAATKFEKQAHGMEKAAEELVKSGEEAKLVKQLQENAEFKKLEARLAHLNGNGLAPAAAIYAAGHPCG